MPSMRRLSFDQYALIRRLAARGAKHRIIARALGVHDNTWWRIRRRDSLARASSRLGRREFHASPMLEDLFDPLPGSK